jgi:tight adherence protein C
VTAAALLVGLAVIFVLAAARELVPAGLGGVAGFLTSSPAGGHRSGSAALKLGRPERLVRAGLDSTVSLSAVLLAKLAGMALGGATAWMVAPAAPGRISLLVAAAMPAAGFVAPDAMLERRARRRRRRLLAALPDALDLLAVSSISGRSPATGFAEIGSAGNGPLAEEMRKTVAEIAWGRPLPAALRSLRDRVPGGEVATLCASIERSRRFGSPLADQLRRQSGALRRDQRRAVEERAARAAPKIQLVVALVLVPSVLLMIAAGLIANADTLLAGL